MFKYILFAALIAASSVSAQSYLCEVKGTNDGNLLPQIIGFRLDEKTGQAEVFDAYIHQHKGKPIRSKAKKTGPDTWSINWSLRLPTLSRQKIKVRYRLKFDSARQIATVRARILDAQNTNIARGKCQQHEW